MSDGLSILAALSYVAGGACMKACDGFARPGWLLGVWLAFLIGCTLQTWSMRGQDLGSNYIVVLGLEATAAFLLGLFAFGESATPARVLGVVLVTVGIGLLRG
jgi:multidrug transporter EmrE-like cation transporter